MAKQKWGDSIPIRTASDTVYDVLHRNIINLNLVPGTVMSEKEISEKMEVSRTPVREAFIRLSNEALVTVVPQKGSFVSKIDLERVREERFLRESLELSVVEDLINNFEYLDLTALYRNVEDQEKALERDETTLFMELDDQFHYALFSLAEKTMCYNVVISFSSHYRRVRFLSMSVAGVSRSNLMHHRTLLECIGNRDMEGAGSIMKTHLRKLNVEKNAIYEQYSEYFIDGALKKDLPLVDEKELFRKMSRKTI